MSPPQVPASRVAAPPIDRRRLTLGIVITTLLVLASVVVDLAIGGRPDPPDLRAAATRLDGAWRFHTGDDARWSAVDVDDTAWETIDLTPAPGSHDDDVGLPDYVGGWMARGHRDHRGYAWYRRGVTVPAGDRPWDVLGPTLVDDGYELYWNGQRLGGSGRLGATPRVVGTRPTRFALPGDASGHQGLLAIRVYMRPASSGGADGGGLHSPPILAPRPASDALHRAHWQRTIAGYVVDVVEPIAMLAVIGLAAWCWPRRRGTGLLAYLGIALVLTAARRSNNAITSWTDLMDLDTYGWLAAVMWVPTVAAWTMAWNRWSGRPWRSVDIAAVTLAVAAIVGVRAAWPVVTSASRFGSLALWVVLGVRIARAGPAPGLALVTLATFVAAVFGGEVLDPLGVPGIWFPFGIGVSRTQYLYAIAIPLLAVLIARTSEGLTDAPMRTATS